MIIFLSISLNMCFGFSKEPSHRDGSFKYPQHTFWLRNKKNNFQLRTLIWGPGATNTCNQLCFLLFQLFFTISTFSAIFFKRVKELWSVQCNSQTEGHIMGPGRLLAFLITTPKLTLVPINQHKYLTNTCFYVCTPYK